MKKILFALFAVGALTLALPLSADPPADKGKKDKKSEAQTVDDDTADDEGKSDDAGVQGIVCKVSDEDAGTGKVMPYPSEEKKAQLLENGACENFTIDKDPDDKIVAGRPCTCKGNPK